jgi:GTPase SAR1 family protein
MAGRAADTANQFLDRRTLIMGDVNCGKTMLTQTIINGFCDEGHARRMVVLDLAPDTIDGIGGKLKVPAADDLLVLTTGIIPPRMTARDDAEIMALARQNAAAIQPMLREAASARRSIMVINDASLYLQAGDVDTLSTLVHAHATVVVNAYYGHRFAPTVFSRHERRQVDILSRHFDAVIHLTHQNNIFFPSSSSDREKP